MATKLKSRLTPAQEIRMVQDIYENFPEASTCLVCQKWDYKKFRFEFIDTETDKYHIVKEEDEYAV